MKTFLSILALCATSVFASAVDEFVVYKATMKIPVVYSAVVGGQTKILTLTLTGDDMVNILLGRNLGSDIHPTKEILAVAVNTEDDLGMPGVVPKSHVIIYDLDAHLPNAAFGQHVADVSTLGFSEAYMPGGNKGFGSATLSVLAHTATDPAKGTVSAGTFAGAATAGGKSASPFASDFNVKQKAALTAGAGRIHVKFTDKDGGAQEINGFMLNGTVKVSGLHIDKFME